MLLGKFKSSSKERSFPPAVLSEKVVSAFWRFVTALQARLTTLSVRMGGWSTPFRTSLKRWYFTYFQPILTLPFAWVLKLIHFLANECSSDFSMSLIFSKQKLTSLFTDFIIDLNSAGSEMVVPYVIECNPRIHSQIVVYRQVCLLKRFCYQGVPCKLCTPYQL